MRGVRRYPNNPVGLSGVLLVMSFAAMAMAGCSEAAERFGSTQGESHRRDHSIARIHDIRVSSLLLARFAGEAIEGSSVAFEELSLEREEMEQAMGHLRDGAELNDCDAFLSVDSAWTSMRKDVDFIVAARTDVLAMADATDRFWNSASELSKKSVDLSSSMRGAGSPDQQLLFAARQSDMVSRLQQRVNDLRTGADQREAIGRDIWMFGRVLEGFKTGISEFGVARVSEQAYGALDPVESSFRTMSEAWESIGILAPSFFEARSASDELSVSSMRLLTQAEALADSTYRAQAGSECSIR